MTEPIDPIEPIDPDAPDTPDAQGPSRRTRAWAATMSGHRLSSDIVQAHAEPGTRLAAYSVVDRERREALEQAALRPGATRSEGAGDRVQPEPADPMRTCFERDRDRILHSSAFRRLAGKTQVFVFPADHQRTRLTHALEVTQVATGIARAAGLNVALTEAIALGHDCGHGPGGHASEEAFDAFLPEGYDHAVWGADVVLTPLNLCRETLDGIRNHSWGRPTPGTPEGEVVSWADRIAYCAHDFEDAVSAGVIRPDDLPSAVAEVCGSSRRQQLDVFISAVIATLTIDGVVGMASTPATALAGLRAFNYDRIYSRPESVAQSAAVVELLRALVEHFAGRPQALPIEHRPDASGLDSTRAAVAYVAGMTDRFAFATAERELAWPAERLPRGIDVPRGNR